ncbi:MAG: RibD family protein [Bdellovibrionota bacterium]
MRTERILEVENRKRKHRGKRPIITLKWVQSLDGQLADDDNCSQWISGTEELQYTHLLRSVHDGVLVGAQTFLKDRCRLTVRNIPFAGTQPVRIVADPQGRVYEALKQQPELFSADASLSIRRTYVLVKELLPGFSDHGCEVIFLACNEGETLEDWLLLAIDNLATEFSKRELRPLTALMVEGGSAILTALLKSGAADTVEIAISPLLLGGSKNRIAPNLRMAENRRLRHLSTEALGQDILLRYQIPKNPEGVSHAG